METKGGCHCHAHALVHHHHRLPPPRAPTPTTHTAAPPTAQMRIFLRFLVRKWTRTGSSYVLGHADSAMTCLNNCHTSWKAVDAIKQDNKHRYSDLPPKLSLSTPPPFGNFSENLSIFEKTGFPNRSMITIQGLPVHTFSIIMHLLATSSETTAIKISWT